MGSEGEAVEGTLAGGWAAGDAFAAEGDAVTDGISWGSRERGERERTNRQGRSWASCQSPRSLPCEARRGRCIVDG